MSLEEDIVKDLYQLDTLQISILFYRMREMDWNQVGKQFGNQDKWAKAKMTEIYKELGFDPEMENKEKSRVLEQDYLPLVKLLTDDNEDNLMDWPLKAKKFSEIQDKITESKKPLATLIDKSRRQKPEKSVDKSVDKPVDNRRRQYLYIGIVSVLIILASFLGYLARDILIPNTPPVTIIITATPQNTPISSPVDTPQLPTFTIQVPSIPTDTPPPTNTVIPTPSNLFEDDFTGGWSDLWHIEGDQPLITADGLKFLSDTLMAIDNKDWTDYELSFDVTYAYCAYSDSNSVATALRYQDPGNMIVLKWADTVHDCNPAWYLVKNGEWTLLQILKQNQVPPGKELGQARDLVVSVSGNTYTTPYGGTITYDAYPSGGFAIIGDKDVVINNVKVVPIR